MIAALLLLAPAFAVDRETVLDHAAAYTLHAWTMTEANETAECASGYVSDYSAGSYLGLPYDWGGYYTLDEYDQAIADGDGAGSHSWHGVLSCTAGVDCSGFVSKTWETGHYSTSTFYKVTQEIGVGDLERADAVNDAGSHIVLYAYETGAGNPVFFEAAGSASRVRINNQSTWSYLDGYQPVRFNEIDDGAQTGTPGEPREITAFPYEDLRFTAGAASDVLDGYACAPTTAENGPEMLYHFTTSTGGRLQAVVSDEDAVDIDVHVLVGGATAEDCVARDDVSVDLEVPAGDVYLVLDTYVGTREFPGPYLLTVDFDGEIGDAQTDTGDDPDTDDTDVPDDEHDHVGGPGKRVPLPRGCSAIGVESSLLVVLLAGVAARRRRVVGRQV